MPGLMSFVGWVGMSGGCKVCPGEGWLFLGVSMSMGWVLIPQTQNCAWLHRVATCSQKCFVTLGSIHTGRSEIRLQNLKHN